MENSASIVRAMGGRDVLPIWALPYAMPMGKYTLLSFEEVLHSMAEQARGRIVPEFLTGHQWKPGGEAAPVSPRVWDMHIEDIARITTGLKEKETYEDEHYQLWREECAKRLPTTAFVYLDELTEWHREYIGKHLDEDGTYPYCNFDISSQVLHIPYRPEEHEIDFDPPIPYPVLAKHKAWFSLGAGPHQESIGRTDGGGGEISLAQLRERWGLRSDGILCEFAMSGQLPPYYNGEPVTVREDNDDEYEFGLVAEAGGKQKKWVDTLPDDAVYSLSHVVAYETHCPKIKREGIFSESRLVCYLEAYEILQSAFHGLTDAEILIWAEDGEISLGSPRGITPRRADGLPINYGRMDKYSGKDDGEEDSLRIANRLVPLFFYEREAHEADPERWLTYAQLTEQAARTGLPESKVAATILHFLDGVDIYNPETWNGKIMHIYDPLARSRKEREGTSRADKLKTALYRAGWIREAFPKIDLSGFAKRTPQTQAQQPLAGSAGKDDDSRHIEMLRRFEAQLKSKAEAIAGTDNAESRFRRICASQIDKLLTDPGAHNYPGALFDAPGYYSCMEFVDFLRWEIKESDLQGDRIGKQIAELVLIEWKEAQAEYLNKPPAAPPQAAGGGTLQAAPEKPLMAGRGGEENPSIQSSVQNPGHGKKPSKAPALFIEAFHRLLDDIRERAEKAGLPFDNNKMPGIKSDLFEVARKVDAEFLSVTGSTFETYIRGLCSFKGRKTSSFYRTLYPEMRFETGEN